MVCPEPALIKPKLPVYDLIIEEASTYMQDVMDFIMVHVLKLKTSEFWKWP